MDYIRYTFPDQTIVINDTATSEWFSGQDPSWNLEQFVERVANGATVDEVQVPSEE